MSERSERTIDDVEGPFGPLLETRVRVLSWNIWWRFGPWEDSDVCHAAELASALGFHHTYGSRMELDGVRFGNAVLSRWPITSHEVLPLPAPPGLDELRTCVRADIHGPRGPLQIYSTHLNWRFDQSQIRQEQVRAICAFIVRSRANDGQSFPPVLCGDLNADPDSDEVRMLTGQAATPEPKLVFHDAWRVAGRPSESSTTGATWTNDNLYARLDLEPDRRIDYVLAGWPKAGGAGHVTDCTVECHEPVDGVVPSDHLGILAELRY